MQTSQARAGVANFAVWALGSAFVSYFTGGSFMWGAVLVPVALILAWRTRYWPEALGALGGFAAICLLYGVLELDAEGYDPAPRLFVGAVVSVSVAVMWRHALGRQAAAPALPQERQALDSPSSPGRLALASVIGAFVIFVLGGFLFIGFGFACQSDTSHATPGSDFAAYCDQVSADDGLGLLIVGGPALAVLVLGLVGAYRRTGAMVLAGILLGVLLLGGVNVWVGSLSNAV